MQKINDSGFGSLGFLAALVITFFISGAISQGNNGIAAFMVPVFFLSGLALYFLPGLEAINREHNNQFSIIILNLLLGWTLVGWVVAYVWAIKNPSLVVVDQIAPSPIIPVITKTCPYCSEEIKQSAIKCKHCGSDLDAPKSRHP
jgi:hypothetical protein